jgi:hypothetical protein
MAKRTKTGLSVERLRELARAGAEATLKRLRAEIEAIERTFPELSNPRRRRKSMARAAKRSRQFTEAARKATSARMKKYWAERRRAAKRAR